MEWWEAALAFVGGSGFVALINLLTSRLKRKDDVKDKQTAKSDKTQELSLKIEQYKVESDLKYLSLHKELEALKLSYNQIFDNLDSKLDDALRHVAKSNALHQVQSVNSIAQRADPYLKAQAISTDDLHSITTEYMRVKDLIGVDDDPDIIYLDGIMDRLGRLPIV